MTRSDIREIDPSVSFPIEFSRPSPTVGLSFPSFLTGAGASWRFFERRVLLNVVTTGFRRCRRIELPSKR